MLPKLIAFLGTCCLLLISQNLWSQCPFSHSRWGTLELTHPEQLQKATYLYPGEYVEVPMRANQCYRVVVIDTLGQDLELALTDSLGQPLALQTGHPGEALLLHWQPSQDASFFLAISQQECQRRWRPVLLLIEWTQPGTTCPAPPAGPGAEKKSDT